jgi:hypothetical protein
MIVAAQSRFHRDRLDGEQIALKPQSFFPQPNLQVVTLLSGDAKPLDHRSYEDRTIRSFATDKPAHDARFVLSLGSKRGRVVEFTDESRYDAMGGSSPVGNGGDYHTERLLPGATLILG